MIKEVKPVAIPTAEVPVRAKRRGELPIETIKADLANELTRRAKAGERLPVGLSATEKGIDKYLESMGESHMRDWHSVIFSKVKLAKPRVKFLGDVRTLTGKVQADRTPRAIAVDNALLAKQIVSVESPEPWLKHPNRYDIRGVDTPRRGRIVAGVAYADKGEKRLSRRRHRGWKKIKFT